MHPLQEGRQTRRSLTRLQGGEAIIHQHPHLLKSSQLPAPFNEGDGCARQIPPTLLSGWLPPTARGAAHLQPLPRQHIIISDLHWRRRRMRRERGRRGGVAVWAGLPLLLARLWAELFSRENLCVREGELGEGLRMDKKQRELKWGEEWIGSG